jgi:uncharacterized protein (DUF433 family)
VAHTASVTENKPPLPRTLQRNNRLATVTLASTFIYIEPRLDLLSILLNTRDMEMQKRISVDPAVMTGKPCIRGTRVTVANLVRQVASGRAIEQICEDYPYICAEDVRAALIFAAEMTSVETHELLAS